jgi:hypothetical protein
MVILICIFPVTNDVGHLFICSSFLGVTSIQISLLMLPNLILLLQGLTLCQMAIKVLVSMVTILCVLHQVIHFHLEMEISHLESHFIENNGSNTNHLYKS